MKKYKHIKFKYKKLGLVGPKTTFMDTVESLSSLIEA